MRTEVVSRLNLAVFLFAHQDDECGVYEQIHLAVHHGNVPVCIFATTGVKPGQSPMRRNHESIAVLGSLGVAKADIIFAGEQLSIADGELIHSLPRLTDWLAQWLAQQTSIVRIYAPAWEGGHPDHDGLHAVAVQIGSEKGILPSIFQYPLYNGFRCVKPFFRLFLPLQQNGMTVRVSIPWRRRLRFLSFVLRYRSQWRTWLGLFPFFLMHYIICGWESIQPVSLARIRERPHAGDLYYETRRFSSLALMRSALDQCATNRTQKPAP